LFLAPLNGDFAHDLLALCFTIRRPVFTALGPCPFHAVAANAGQVPDRWINIMLKFRNLLCVFAIFALPCLIAAAQTAPALNIYFIDVEGGQSTLIVAPEHQSLLVDTGYPGFNGRDADRIVAAAKEAGLKQLDYVWITHYHADHVGGVPQLAAKIKISTFVDHGPNREDTATVRPLYAAYQQVFSKAKHLVLKPGDTLPLKGVHLQVLTADGEHITSNLPGGGQRNPYCASEPEHPEDPTENARSLGAILTFGKFRFLDLGDLTKRKEVALVCPVNRIGTVDVYLTSHHGLDLSNSSALVNAVHPRVAIMNNGAHKGGEAPAWQRVHDSPGLEDLWQLHYAVAGGPDHNVAEKLIANPQESNDQGKYLKLSAHADGSFTVLNSRNGYSKTYAAK
jgi:beta-lactamase superfamily II metal-dependent hydrolase